MANTLAGLSGASGRLYNAMIRLTDSAIDSTPGFGLLDDFAAHAGSVRGFFLTPVFRSAQLSQRFTAHTDPTGSSCGSRIFSATHRFTCDCDVCTSPFHRTASFVTCEMERCRETRVSQRGTDLHICSISTIRLAPRSKRNLMMSETAVETLQDCPDAARLLQAMQQYWGYDSFRPLQQDAMTCVLQQRDSVVVLPTGGGKSLCFQVPALCQDGLAVVVSPLISLMKDQVDSLTDNGVAAAYVNSTLSTQERLEVANRIRSGELRLLYAAPERLVQPRTIEFLKDANVRFFAIDEAHCISQWGHNFRPEYRELNRLRDEFPETSVHAFTATATEQVRDDIAAQLNLSEPEVLVGSFDRPNLVYRVLRRASRLDQIRSVIDKHRGESGIIYCISRKDVENTSEQLNSLGYRTRPYHAGLEDETRKAHQDAFIKEEVDTIVATVAFGMGIDKSNVRYVVHGGMPKSLEHYQQEAGRAGRDGLGADCTLIYSMSDFSTWQRIIEDGEPDNLATSMTSLNHMANYCTGVTCRHRQLVEHFGEAWHRDSCGACDVCLGDVETVDDALVIAQKIVSCVFRQEQRFGGDYTAKVLKGSSDQRILQNKHDELSTYGLLSEFSIRTIRDWVEQLVSQGFLQKTGEYNVLHLTESSRGVLKGEVTPKLLKSSAERTVSERVARSVAEDSWEGVDRDLFEELRVLRREKAADRGVPPYIVFSDATLRDLARRRPSRLDVMRTVKGVGDKKLRDYGDEFLKAVTVYCNKHGVAMNVRPGD